MLRAASANLPDWLPNRSNIGVHRWHNNSGGTVGTRTEQVTYSLKMEAEGDFDAVALMWVNYETNAVNNCKAVVAATDTFSTAGQSNRFTPMLSAVTHNALRAATDVVGWDAVTWGGASTVNIPAANGVAAPSVVISDWMPIASVPRSDGGTRPLVLARYYHDGVADGSFTFTQQNWATTMGAANANNRGRVLDVGEFLGDGIAALTSTFAAGIRTALVAPIFRYRHRTLTVANVGDSISMGTGSTSGLDNWCRRACFDLSTPTAPVVPMNMGCASQTTATFLGFAKTVLAAAKPSVAFYFPYSPNDGTDTDRELQNCMVRMSDFIAFCNANGIAPILGTPVPVNTNDSTTDAYRKTVRANILAMGASGAVTVADFTLVTSDLANPERWIAGLNSDNLHPNDAGHEAMATVAKAAVSMALQGR